MKKMTQAIFTVSMIFIGFSGFAGKSFAAQSCPDAVSLDARFTADADTGADPDLMSEECMPDYSSIKSIGQNKYSILVDCPESPEMMYDVTVSQDGDMCRAVDATQDKSYKPANSLE
jgi:hypothetical protein